jgi:hypothetical protein
VATTAATIAMATTTPTITPATAPTKLQKDSPVGSVLFSGSFPT